MQAGVETPSRIRPGLFSRLFRALGWVMVATWLYIHAFGLAVTYWPGNRPYLEGLPWRIFQGALVSGFYLGPLWFAYALGVALVSVGRKQWPALADVAIFMLLVCLIGVYFYLAAQD